MSIGQCRRILQCVLFFFFSVLARYLWPLTPHHNMVKLTKYLDSGSGGW